MHKLECNEQTQQLLYIWRYVNISPHCSVRRCNIFRIFQLWHLFYFLFNLSAQILHKYRWIQRTSTFIFCTNSNWNVHATRIFEIVSPLLFLLNRVIHHHHRHHAFSLTSHLSHFDNQRSSFEENGVKRIKRVNKASHCTKHSI